MANNKSKNTNRSVDLGNGSMALFFVVVGAFFLSDLIDGIGEGQLPFLFIGLILVAIGVFRIVYRLVKGKWFRVFGRNDADA